MSGNFEQVVQKIAPDGKIARTWQLMGGVSAQVTAVEIAHPDGTVQKVVVRQYGERDLHADPQIAAHEFRLLQIVRAAGVPVPTPYYADVLGELVGSPAIMIEFIDGAADFSPVDVESMAVQLATQLATIHCIDGTDEALAFLPRQTEKYAARIAARPNQMDEGLLESEVRAVLEQVWPVPQTNPSVLLHGDYWPGNILWNEGRVAAIIDWEDAAVGDPLADVANARLELYLAFGQEAMEQFTITYQSLMSFNFSHLPYWELGATLRLIVGLPNWGLDEAEENRIRSGLRAFIEQTLRDNNKSSDSL